MHEEKIALVRRQIEALAAAVASRNIRHVWVVACGGSLATLDPFRYILTAETDKVSAAAVNAAEFAAELPKGLGEDCLVVLNSQSGTTAETVRAAQLAKERGALTAAYTTAPESPLEQAVDFPIYYYDDPVNPYPLLLSIFPEVYQTVFALLDVWEGTKRLPIMETAMENLEEVCGRATASFKPEALEFAANHRTEPIIYTVSAGLDRCIAYILTNCSFMESVWRHSSPLHAGELFHGACDHVVYVPVVEKQILWSKRCKDKALVGTVKETVMQVSRSKKWASKPLLDDAGKPVLQKNGKPVLKKSYSVLQDDFFNYMRNAGYTDVERGERGSTEEHLTVTQFKVQREQERLDALTAQANQQAQSLAKTCQTLSKKEKELAAVQKKATLTKEALIHARDLDYIGKRTFLGNYSLTEEEFSKLKKQADHGYMMDVENRRLKEELSTAKKEAAHWGQKYHELWYEVKPYLDALHRAPELVRGFLEKILAPKQEHTMNVPQQNRKRGQDMEL